MLQSAQITVGNAPNVNGPFRPSTRKELAMIGTMKDREVARRTNRSLSAVCAEKFSLRERSQ